MGALVGYGLNLLEIDLCIHPSPTSPQVREEAIHRSPFLALSGVGSHGWDSSDPMGLERLDQFRAEICIRV